jgi:phosphoribosyl 1,2-cyclic phosphodiesterase
VITFSLQSGSNGNAIYVEAGDVRLLFDAGISARLAETRMKVHGRSLQGCDALIISHNHSDHVKGAGTIHRRFRMPIYLTESVYQAVRPQLGLLRETGRFVPGQTLTFRDVKVHTILTPHDGIDTVCFVIEHDGRRLGIFTDLGHPFPALREALSVIDAAYLESNYDPDLLRISPYSEFLKQRITGDGGHISNEEAADLSKTCVNPRIKWLAVAHLSECNNRPELAVDAQRRLVGESFPVRVASRYEAGELLEV